MTPVPLINFGTDWDFNVITLTERKVPVSLWFLYFYRVREMVWLLKIPEQQLPYIQIF